MVGSSLHASGTVTKHGSLPLLLKATTSGHASFAASHSEAADPAKLGSSVRSVTTGRSMTVPRVADFLFATIASLIVSERVFRQQIPRTLQSVPYISPMIAILNCKSVYTG